MFSLLLKDNGGTVEHGIVYLHIKTRCMSGVKQCASEDIQFHGENNI